jgi:hypothetical protein
MTTSVSIFSPAAQEHNRGSIETCTVYSVACDDGNGTRAHVFCFEADALRWLAENAEGPNDNTRAELLLTRDDDAFWQLFEDSREDLANYRLESHDLQLQPNLF